MGAVRPNAVTQLLCQLREPGADTSGIRDRLYELLYPELREIAGRVFRRNDPSGLLQPTILVHEAFLKFLGNARIEWKDRAHFLGMATLVMRQVAVDYARRARTAKRGHGWRRLTLDEGIAAEQGDLLDLLDLDRALNRLAAMSARMARVVECRVFGGMTHEEVAEALSVSVRTIYDDWAVARRWLSRELAPGG